MNGKQTPETELQNTKGAKRKRRNSVWNCSSKTGSRRQSRKKTILKHSLKGCLPPRKITSAKICENLLTNQYRSLDVATPIRFTIFSCKKRIVLRMQPRQQATLTQPFQCDLQARIQETHRTTYAHRNKHSFQNTEEEPNDPIRNRRTHTRGSHFTRKNTRFRAPASSPQHRACNIHAAIPMRSASTDSRNA